MSLSGIMGDMLPREKLEQICNLVLLKCILVKSWLNNIRKSVVSLLLLILIQLYFCAIRIDIHYLEYKFDLEQNSCAIKRNPLSEPIFFYLNRIVNAI